MMCGISSQLGEHRMRTKYNDIEKANLAYRKQRKHTHKQTRKMIIRLLVLPYLGAATIRFPKDF